VIESQRSSIESLIEHVRQQKSFVEHPDLLAEWARYLCVRISGAIEVCVREILAEYADVRGGPQLRNFVQSRLSRSGGLKTSELLALCGLFDPAWEASIEKTLDAKTQLRDAVNSIVSNRHIIAHGGDVGVSFVNVQAWSPRVFDVIELVAAECGV